MFTRNRLGGDCGPHTIGLLPRLVTTFGTRPACTGERGEPLGCHYEPEQRAPICIAFGRTVHSITMITTRNSSALKCSGASLGRMIGYRNGAEVVNVTNVLADPGDCGEDDVTWGAQGQIPANAGIDSLVLEGPDPWTFDVQGSPGRARLDYIITYNPTVSVGCEMVTRGQPVTCQILGVVDSVSGWRFVGPVIPYVNDSVRVSSTSTALTWSGVAVVSGTVSAVVTVAGTLDTVSGPLTVSDRTGTAWRWDDGSKWTFRQDGSPVCAYAAFVVPGSTLLGMNRRTSTCAIGADSALQRVSIEPSVRSPAAQDSGFTAASVAGGPNDGLWYVTAVHYYMDRTSEMNPFIRSAGPADTLTNNTDQRLCRQALNLGNHDPVVVNFYTYNSACRAFSLTPLFDAIWAHEGFGTNNPLDPAVANGHEARRRIAARDQMNDPYRIAEPLVRASYSNLRADLTIAVDDADRNVNDGADSDHAFVNSNYLVQGSCGKAWVFDSSLRRYNQIQLQIKRLNGTFVCM